MVGALIANYVFRIILLDCSRANDVSGGSRDCDDGGGSRDGDDGGGSRDGDDSVRLHQQMLNGSLRLGLKRTSVPLLIQPSKSKPSLFLNS